MTGTSPQVSSYQACASLCYWHNQCDAFTWNSFNLNCFLKSAVAFSTGSQHASGESGVRGDTKFNLNIFLFSIDVYFRSCHTSTSSRLLYYWRDAYFSILSSRFMGLWFSTTRRTTSRKWR